jgi:hypothetical protein
VPSASVTAPSEKLRPRLPFIDTLAFGFTPVIDCRGPTL